MNDTTPWGARRAGPCWIVALLLGGLALGCRDAARPPPDPQAVEKEAEKLKEQHKREMESR